VPMDHAGYIRLNVRGREPEGIVEPGPEYEALCDQVIEGFLDFQDLSTGRPIARRVYRQHDLAPGNAPARNRLPDLVVEWGEVSPIESCGIRSERHGELRWSPANRIPSGRAGNHRDRGWFVVSGTGVRPGLIQGHTILDLVPTVCDWLGADLGGRLQGQPIPMLADGHA